MTESPTYAPGAPIWVDVASPDLDGSKQFYGTLFGWDAFVTPDPEAGGYTMFLLNGKEVAGLGPIFNPGQPSAWSVYFATEDADATAKAVQDAGGQVVAPPFDVMTAGRMAIFTDPSGAFFGVWQPGEHRGAGVLDQPGAMAWHELNTRDAAGAREFYGKVFGWQAHLNQMGDTMTYTEFEIDGKRLAGAYEMGEEIPAEVPPHWRVYFDVADCDSSVSKTEELGGSVIVPAMDAPPGRFAILGDPNGAAFGVIKQNR
jgi:predicted enzyme related to lactoylglutathione lyase